MAKLIWKAKRIYDSTVGSVAPVHGLVRASVWRFSDLLLGLCSRTMRFELVRDDAAPYFRFGMPLGRYQSEIVGLYTRLLRRGMVVADVGAHVGYHTVRFARLIGPTGKVFAFEPCPATFDVLKRNVRRHKLSNVVLEPMAVTGRSGRIPLYFSYSSLGNSVVRMSGAEHVLVDCVSLDEYFDRARIRNVDLVKINVEGAEVDVLQGMRTLLAHSPGARLITEFYPAILKAAGHSPSRLLELLFELGFQVCEIKRKGVLAPVGYADVHGFVSSVPKLTSLFACTDRSGTIERC